MNQRTQTTKELLEDLRRSRPKRRKRPTQGTDWVVFGSAGALALGFILWGLISSSSLGSFSASALDFVISKFSWLYVIAATVFTVFVLVVAFSRFGRIPLGRDG